VGTTLGAALLAILFLVATLATAPAASAAAPSVAPPTVPSLTNIRIGRHLTYDRVVLDFTSPARDFQYSWVNKLYADPSGKPVTLRGNKFLQVVVHGAATYDVNSQQTYFGPKSFRAWSTRNVAAVAITGDFERTLTVGIGARHQSWVRVFPLGNRLVIDIGR
jgi:hypothetical protein